MELLANLLIELNLATNTYIQKLILVECYGCVCPSEFECVPVVMCGQ